MKLTQEQIEEGVEKMRAGVHLFKYACEVTLAGIRHQFPEATESECEEILRGRLQQSREREQADDPERRS